LTQFETAAIDCVDAPLWRALAARLAGAALPSVPPAVPDAAALALGLPFLAWLGLPVPPEVAKARLHARFRRISALRLAVTLQREGHRFACLKGMAAAHTLYDDPDIRPMADMDLLADPAGMSALIARLQAMGLVFAPARSRSPWGLVSDASLRPLLAPDGSINLDLHSLPDAWPLPAGLSTAAVLGAARTCTTSEGEIPVPSPTHLLVLAASHAARDLFALDSAKNLVDALHLLIRTPDAVDWREIAEIADRAGLERAFATFFGLIIALSGRADLVPTRWRQAVPGLPRLAASFSAFDRSAFTLSLPSAEKLRREWLFCGPRIAAGRWARRVRGLIVPRDGTPQ
jgi:hypothetical protein